MNLANNRVWGAAAGEASTDGAKICSGVAALLALQLAIILLKSCEKFKQPHFQFFKVLAR